MTHTHKNAYGESLINIKKKIYGGFQGKGCVFCNMNLCKPDCQWQKMEMYRKKFLQSENSILAIFAERKGLSEKSEPVDKTDVDTN